MIAAERYMVYPLQLLCVDAFVTTISSEVPMFYLTSHNAERALRSNRILLLPLTPTTRSTTHSYSSPLPLAPTTYC